MPFQYPQTRRCDQTDTYHGTAVADPYRWLEDPNSDETKTWVEAQNEVTFGYLRELPAVEPLKKRLTELWNYERYSVPFKRGGRYFYYKNDGLQNQAVLYTQPSLEAEPVVLLDPNTLSTDGTVALGSIAVSEDGRYLAYSLSSSGSDWLEWKVRDIKTGEDTADHLQWSKFSGALWSHDNQGFFYSRYDAPLTDSQFEEVNYFQKLFYHRLGTLQSEDTLVYERPDEKEWGFHGRVTHDGHYLVIYVWRGTDSKNLIFYKDLQDPNGEVIELISEFEASYRLIDNDGTTFWFKTDLNASRGRVIALDLTQGNVPTEIIPEAEETLDSVSLLNNQFVANYLKDAYTTIQIFDLAGHPLRTVALPGIGSVGGFDGKKEDTETFYQFSSFTVPSRIYRYNMETGEQSLFREAEVAFDPNQYETQQVFYTSKDGTRVPMFITHKKGITPNGQTPTLLYGYGGFNIPLSPNFSVGNLVWLEMGGIYAVANLRGGGEYGKTWHQAGTKLTKQNVFDDFISAAEWLIDNNYTASENLAIMGRSNGGLLVGACMIQRPDLFAAALPAVGVMDMLRFNQFTIGWAWESDYGSPQDPEEFKALYAYSPLHNLNSASYPSTLITTADHDDRVVPAHSFKFAATLQAVHQGDNPVLIRIETKAGHGAGKPTAKIIEEVADKWAFLVKTLDAEGKHLTV
ncbi:S9 family peptidase [Leptolyngbyaceae cyanobacterium CCMR0082]|uniref:prolyl oligopeptidase n=1 Tax=Adonisia turfae CCMR0082 TaxID=2304604 RepID=A0A6M0RZS3_9CYAN|nr:prolyl oligopeptidase family serine peptidase [Adonisia turfae]NEZ61704.1 S9 family peptidase [Adonisia turfae CCMR0082]